MPIVPLPQFEADVAELERERLVESLRCKGHDSEQLAGLSLDELKILDGKKKPDTLVVRYGRMKMIGEFPYSGDMTPGCGSKLVVRTTSWTASLHLSCTSQRRPHAAHQSPLQGGCGPASPLRTATADGKHHVLRFV